METKGLASKGTVVVIDDHDATLHFFEEALSYLGYTPLVAKGGAKGIELCQTNEVDLVLTDYYMPKMSGIEVAEKLKALPDSPPVVLTSASYRHSFQDFSEKGIDYFLGKPFELKELELILNDVLGRPKISSISSHPLSS